MKIYLLAIFQFFFLYGNAQITIDRQVIAGFGSSSELSSSTLGEVFIFDGENSGIILTQGFQQNETGQSVSTIETTLGFFHLNAYPNPCRDRLTLEFDRPGVVKAYRIISVDGRLLSDYQYIRERKNKITIDTNGLPPGLLGIVIQDTKGIDYLAGWISHIL